MAKPKAKNAFEAATSQLFDPKMIYASAFEHAARQIQDAMGSGEQVSAMIRAQAQQLVEFADLLDATLEAKEASAPKAAAQAEPGEGKKDEKREEPGEGKTDEAPKE